MRYWNAWYNELLAVLPPHLPPALRARSVFALITQTKIVTLCMKGCDEKLQIAQNRHVALLMAGIMTLNGVHTLQSQWVAM